MIQVYVSVGELFDKISILELKLENIDDVGKCANIQKELDCLLEASASIEVSLELEELKSRLKAVNGQLWETEDLIRMEERNKEFGDKFVGLARSVYRLNDERASIKAEINRAIGSGLVEEKSYQDY